MSKQLNQNNSAKAVFLGATLAFCSVALGAFGAHGLEEHLAAIGQSETYATASEYLFYHALALLLVGNLMAHWSTEKGLVTVMWLMLAGICIFSGSLFLLALTGIKWLGAITPVGGILLLVAWVILSVCGWQSKKSG